MHRPSICSPVAREPTPVRRVRRTSSSAASSRCRRAPARPHGTMGAVRHPWSLLLLLVVACGGAVPGTPASCPEDRATVSFSKHAQLDVQVAADDATREHGLMGVTTLPENHGMAFRWDTPTDATFWMKDTLIPLSIAFVD